MLKMRAEESCSSRLTTVCACHVGHVVVGGDLTTHQMTLPVNHKGVATPVKHLSPNRVCRIAVSKLDPVIVILRRRDVVPVDRRISGDDAQLLIVTQTSVDGTHGSNHLFSLHAEAVRDRVVLPRFSQDIVGDVIAAHEPINGVLIPRARGFDDDVVDRARKPSITDERQEECLHLHVAVRIGQRDDVMCPKGVEDGGNGLDRCGRFSGVVLRRGNKVYASNLSEERSERRHHTACDQHAR